VVAPDSGIVLKIFQNDGLLVHKGDTLLKMITYSTDALTNISPTSPPRRGARIVTILAESMALIDRVLVSQSQEIQKGDVIILYDNDVTQKSVDLFLTPKDTYGIKPGMQISLQAVDKERFSGELVGEIVWISPNSGSRCSVRRDAYFTEAGSKSLIRRIVANIHDPNRARLIPNGLKLTGTVTLSKRSLISWLMPSSD
jgi:hypothetical protein